LLCLLLVTLGSCWTNLSPVRDAAVQLSSRQAPVRRSFPDVEALTVRPEAVEPLSQVEARKVNSDRPFSALPNPAALPFHFVGTDLDRERAISCLAAAQIYEAGDDPEGERAVAQVVLNRVRHPAFPPSVCGVVFQGAERSTGCQFTFTCDGAMRRVPSSGAWDKARAIAAEMLAGRVFPAVGLATHYHTDWVVPYWSSSLDKVAAVDTHLFFRWPGGWGRPSSFRRTPSSTEPAIAQLSRLSSAHKGGTQGLDPINVAGLRSEDAVSLPPLNVADVPLPLSSNQIRTIARMAQSNTFIVQFAETTDPLKYDQIAREFCHDQQQCVVMAWRADDAPTGFPLKSGAISSMIFNYIQDEERGAHQSFWNCTKLNLTVKGRCIGGAQAS
jgi:hypothetical protein